MGAFLLSLSFLLCQERRILTVNVRFPQMLQKILTTLSKLDIISSVNNNRSKGRYEIGETYFCLFRALLQYRGETV